MDRFKEVGYAKGITISPETMACWFTEFIRRKWKKALFDRRVAVVRVAQVFNRLDLADWLKDEIMYPEFELALKVDEAMERRIKMAEELERELKRGIKLTKEQEDMVLLLGYRKFKAEVERERSLLIEKLIEEEAMALKQEHERKKKIIREMSLQTKLKFLPYLMDRSILVPHGTFEENIMLHHMDEYADLIETKVLDDFIRECEIRSELKGDS